MDIVTALQKVSIFFLFSIYQFYLFELFSINLALVLGLESEPLNTKKWLNKNWYDKHNIYSSPPPTRILGLWKYETKIIRGASLI